jgi:hypothetical protein
MRFTSIVSVLSAMMLLQACGGGDDDPKVDLLSISPAADQSVQAGATSTYTISGLDNDTRYRVTLVVDANIEASGGGGTFEDADDNGAADAGASENIALITKINGTAIAGVKTTPGGMDDPANPTGVIPQNGQIIVEITGVAPGKVYPVAYENGGETTFLELDEEGAAVETYGVGGGLTVSGASGKPVVLPNLPQTLAVGATVDYTIYGLTDTQAYRVTLVLGANATVNFATGTFADANMDGVVEAGASENVALITAVNGTALSAGAKTVPDPTDDPASPTGVFPVGNKITVTVSGVAAGTVYPVAYYNGGDTTLLEVDSTGAPVEVYGVGGPITVQ